MAGDAGGGGATSSNFCDATSLPPECFLDPEYQELLEATCRLCQPPRPPRWSQGTPAATSSSCQEDDGTLADLALGVIMRIFPQTRLCALGYLVAYLLTVQYSSSTRPFELPAAILELADEAGNPYSWSHGFDLRPFPFWSERRSLGAQFSFHSRFFAAHLWRCGDTDRAAAEEFRGRFHLRAGHDKPEVHCAARLSDFQLVKRCRDRRRVQHHTGMQSLGIDVQAGGGGALLGLPPPRIGRRAAGVASIECPDAEARAKFATRRERELDGSKAAERAELAVLKAYRKYSQRSHGGTSERQQPGLGCEVATAEWKIDLAPYHKCILTVILERLRLPPGAMVLDWGTGCGHKLTWAAQLYDIDGLGVDIVADSIQWAQAHSIGRYCEVDGRFLGWLPDDYFDAVISYAALMHLEPNDQCNVVAELVGKVRVGGQLWFGWNDPGINQNDTELEALLEDDARTPTHDVWRQCFTKAARSNERWASGDIAVAWETQEEALLFPDDNQAVSVYLYYPPAYSLFVTRLPPSPSFEPAQPGR